LGVCVKYDDASWHYGGNFPKGLPERAGATHIGMFVAWMIVNKFHSEELAEDVGEFLEKLLRREITGAEFVMAALDEKFTDQDLNKEGNGFTLAYYQGKNNASRYVEDYFALFGVDESSCYGVGDTWENFDLLAPHIAARLDDWRRLGRPTFLKK
jgi:hypothetical protein